MKNLGHYIIPQVFNNTKFKYHKNQLFEHVLMNETEKDLPKEISNYEVMFNFIEFDNSKWKLMIEKNNDFKYLFWNEHGEFLGILGDS